MKSRYGHQKSTFILSLLLLLSVVVVYWRVFKYPYVQDDWFILGEITKLGNVGFIADRLSGFENIFYRPLGSLYFLFVYNIFNLNSAGFHFFALTIHFCSSLLIAYIIFTLTQDGVISWVIAFFYATAITIHLDSLLWMVGIYDIGGAFLFFLSIACFIKDKTKFSALAFGLAILMKESTIILPAILFLYMLFWQKNWKPLQSNIRSIFVRLFPHFIIIVFYGLFRFRGLLTSFQTDQHPYSINFGSPHIIDNLNHYGKWCLDSILPQYGLSIAPIFFFSGLFGLVILYLKGNTLKLPNLFFAVGWLLSALVPVVFMPNHVFRYYLTYSLAAYFFILAYAFRFTALFLNIKENVFSYLMMIFVTINVVLSSTYLFRLDVLGVDGPTMEGSNNLIRKGSYVSAVRDILREHYPTLPKGAALLFNLLPTISFGCNAGPRIWYNDSTISVYEAVRVPSGVYLHNPMLPDTDEQQVIRLDHKTSFMFTLDGKKTRIFRLSDEDTSNPFSNMK